MKIRFAAVSILIIAVCAFASGIETPAAANAKVLVDGKLINLDKQTEIINGRIIAPVRGLSESIGASVGWDAGAKRITVYFRDRYVIMRIGDPNMLYGQYRSDGTGRFSYETQWAYVLEAPPFMAGGQTYAPLRGLAESLGVEVTWDANNSVVYISSRSGAAAPQPASPTPTPAPVYKNRYFEEISANRAQNWYDQGAPYILFYYSHLSESAMAVLQWAQQAAERQNLMIYGVDTDSSVYNNTGNSLTFIWGYLDKTTDKSKPSLFFVGRAHAVVPLVQPRDIQSIDFCMAAFRYDVSRGSTEVNDSADMPQKILDGPLADISPYWREISMDDAIRKYNNNDRFIYICYNSRNAESSALTPMIWLAVSQTQTIVYATDFLNSTVGDRDWFGKDALNGRQLYAYPTIFFVYGRDYIPFGAVQPRNVLEIINAFYNFAQFTR
ncbi:MAG: copper amine oxidase N-terminal domain-containing protein [Clostridiales bacterium]|jgi:N-acetylmuramoyl-L-alanine amidase|nr:copper amine oxidase N-terminal domain-containing protein [Clostridiales bacterium]